MRGRGGRSLGFSLVVVVAAALVLPMSAGAVVRLRFSPPRPVAGSGLTAISCAGASLCAAVDRTGDVVTSADPTASQPSWRVSNIDATTTLGAISCPTSSLCVAGDNNGDLLVSSDPALPAASWQTISPTGFSPLIATASRAPVYLSPGVRGLSCASVALCAAVSFSGFSDSIPTGIESSTNPTGGESAWGIYTGFGSGLTFEAASCPTVQLCVLVDQSGSVATNMHPSHGNWNVVHADKLNAMTAVSCPIAQLCVAGDYFGNLIVSTRPTRHWTVYRRLDGYNQITGVSCPLVKLCVAVDHSGNVFTSSRPTGGAHAWRRTFRTHQPLTAISCASRSRCLAVDARGDVLVGTRR